MTHLLSSRLIVDIDGSPYRNGLKWLAKLSQADPERYKAVLMALVIRVKGENESMEKAFNHA